MPMVYSVEYQGITVSAANSKGSLYPILRKNISTSHSERSMTVYFAVPNTAPAQSRRALRILWSRKEQVQGIYYCAFKATCNTTNLKRSDCPLEVHHWMGALGRNTNYSSERGYRRNQTGWPVVTPKPMGSKLAAVDFQIRKVRNSGAISANLPKWTSASHGFPLSVDQLRKSGVEVDLETSSIAFHFIFEAVAYGPASHLLPRGSKRKRDDETVVKIETIELSDDSDDGDSLNRPRESGNPQKRRKQPPGLNSTCAPPVMIDLTLDDPPQPTDPKLSIVGAWRRLNALTVEKGELVDRMKELIKKDEARVQEMKDFMSKYEK